MDEERCCGLRAEGGQMVRSAVQVRSGAARFSVAVQAESIERALEIAKKQNLGRELRCNVPHKLRGVLRRGARCDVWFGLTREIGGETGRQSFLSTLVGCKGTIAVIDRGWGGR